MGSLTVTFGGDVRITSDSRGGGVPYSYWRHS